jgi:lipopolysaccharide transport system ATP-binding protein
MTILDASIDARDVSVLFPLYHGNSRSLKKMLVAAASGRLTEDQQHRVVVRALSDINFSLKSGERLGLIGANGAWPEFMSRSPAASASMAPSTPYSTPAWA